MAIDPQLTAAMARELLGWESADAASLAKTARRLDALMRSVQDEERTIIQSGFPAFAFDAAHAAGLPEEAAGHAGPPAQTPEAQPAGINAPSGDPLDWSALELAAAIRRRQVSPVEVTEAVLERIALRDPDLNAFVTILADQALAEARRAEQEAPRGPLHGVPVAVKDLFDVAGVLTTAGSRLRSRNQAERDAAAVARLRAAGAIVIGKTATHEFAYGTTTDSPFHGPTRNPRDLQRSPGGSSGGSGAAVAAAMVPLALGSDTAGSIRIPAACCGVAGLMPTYGRVSRTGTVPLSWSLDHVGPIARSVADLALALSVLAGGPDPADPAASGRSPSDYLHAARSGREAAGPQALRGIRIGLPAAWLTGPVDPGVSAGFDRAVAVLRELGAAVVEVSLPPLRLFHFISRLLTLAEAGAYHAPNLPEGADQYGPDVRARVELGQFILARDYLLAQRLRTEVAGQTGRVMAEGGIHALVLPTMPVPAPMVGQRTHLYPGGEAEPVGEAMIRFTAPFNVTGQPVVSIPCGKGSVQLVGRPFGEAGLLYIAAALEAALNERPS